MRCSAVCVSYVKCIQWRIAYTYDYIKTNIHVGFLRLCFLRYNSIILASVILSRSTILRSFTTSRERRRSSPMYWVHVMLLKCRACVLRELTEDIRKFLNRFIRYTTLYFLSNLLLCYIILTWNSILYSLIINVDLP